MLKSLQFDPIGALLVRRSTFLCLLREEDEVFSLGGAFEVKGDDDGVGSPMRLLAFAICNVSLFIFTVPWEIKIDFFPRKHKQRSMPILRSRNANTTKVNTFVMVLILRINRTETKRKKRAGAGAMALSLMCRASFFLLQNTNHRYVL